MSAPSAPARRWLYHAVTRAAWERALSAKRSTRLARRTGRGRVDFIHASYRDVVSPARSLYLPNESARHPSGSIRGASGGHSARNRGDSAQSCRTLHAPSTRRDRAGVRGGVIARDVDRSPIPVVTGTPASASSRSPGDDSPRPGGAPRRGISLDRVDGVRRSIDAASVVSAPEDAVDAALVRAFTGVAQVRPPLDEIRRPRRPRQQLRLAHAVASDPAVVDVAR